jgi:hypothetical protein
MSENIVQAWFGTPDGKYFATREEAVNHVRIPQIKAALAGVCNGNTGLMDRLMEVRDALADAFEVGGIRRVTRKEKKDLADALDAVIASEAIADEKNPALAFLIENAGAIKDSFRWPAAKRMSEEEKTVAQKNSILAVVEGDEALRDWIYTNREALLNAFEAGKVKRQVSDKAKEALEAYRAKRAAEKAQEEDDE